MIKMTISLIGLAVAGAVFFMVTRPGYEKLQTTEKEIREYNQALEKAAELQQLKQSLLSHYNAFNSADLDRLHKLLPDHVDNVRLVLDLDSMAGRHAMALQNVVVSNPVSEGTTGPAPIGGGGKQKYGSLTLKFSTHGTYENFTEFLQDLEASLRIVDLVSLALEREAGTPGSPSPAYRYEMTIRTYWLK